MSIKDIRLFKKATSEQKRVSMPPKQTPDDLRTRLMQMAEGKRLQLREKPAA
jgi:hypothetical protein